MNGSRVDVPRVLAVAVIGLALLTPALGAQVGSRAGRRSADSAQHAMQLMAEAAQLEQAGRYLEAADAYRRVLGEEPARLPALLGLERVLRAAGRVGGIRPQVEAALAAEPSSDNIRELDFRVAAELDGATGAARAAQAWMAANPASAEPYRAWAFWLAANGDLVTARQVIAAGADRLGERRVAPYAAQLFVASGDWAASAYHWRIAVEGNEGYQGSAAGSLRAAPPPAQREILRVLLGGPGVAPPARRLAAELLLAWGRPDEGWVLLDAALPSDPALARSQLRRFAERARELRTPDALRARGYALERLSEYAEGHELLRLRLEAARAFADAGELNSARRLLERVPDGRIGESAEDAAAMAALIEVLADAGRVDEAERYFAEWEPALSGDATLRLRERLAWARLLAGDFERAEQVLSRDSSIRAEAIRGWIAAYRGELGPARRHFAAAGPIAVSRDEATHRTRVLVLLERLTVTEDAGIGRALLRLARGDTLGAVGALADAAPRYAGGHGGADLLAWAGELATAAGQYTVAEGLLLDALAADERGPTAPAALFTLASAYAGLGRKDDAVARLEELILGYPESAMVPRARRLLDELRGLVPRS